MKILEIAASGRIGGAETYLLRLEKHLRARGHGVICVTRRDVPLALQLRAQGATVRPFHRGGKFNLAVLWKLVRLIRREKIELIHTHLFSACRVGGLAGKITRVPVVGHVQATDPADIYRHVPILIAVSEGVRQHMIAQGIAPSRLHLFPNNVDLLHFNPANFGRETARRDLGIAPETFALAVVASLTPRKAHRFLWRALAQLPRHFEVWAIGEGGEESALRDLARELGIENRVHFAGFQPDVRPFYAACDATVLPSLHEGLPLCLLEAMAMNCPVVATRVAGIPEIVRQRETGLLVEPSDSEALREAISRLENPALRARLVTGAREMVERDYEERRGFERVEAFLKQVAAKASRGGRAQVLKWR